MVTLSDSYRRTLQTIGCYHVATRSTLSAAISPDAESPDKLLSKLAKGGFIRVHQNLPGNRSLYQLTKKGAVAIGLSPARGRLMGTQSLLKNLAVLHFCFAVPSDRHRVETRELAEALGAPLSEGAYCLCRAKEHVVIFECYVPGAQTPITTIERWLRKRLQALRQVPTLAEAIQDLRYGFAVLVPNKQRRKAVMDAVRTKGPQDRVPLIKRVRVWVEVIEELSVFFTAGASPSASHRRRGSDLQTILWDK